MPRVKAFSVIFANVDCHLASLMIGGRTGIKAFEEFSTLCFRPQGKTGTE